MTSRLDELFADLPIRLDVHQVAELLGITNKGVYKWISEGTIPAYKLGSSWMILRDELKDTLGAGSNLTHRFPPQTDGPETQQDQTDG